MGIGYNPSIVTNGLLVYLDAANPKSYPGSGSTWFDLSGNGYNGALVAAPTYSSGNFLLNGTSQKADLGNAVGLQINAGTLIAWVKGTSGNSGYRGIVAKQSAWGMFLSDNVFVIYDWGNSITRSTGITLGNGIWAQVVMAFTDSSGTPSNNVALYVNGVAVLTTTNKLSNQNMASVQVGDANASQWFSGNVATASIYNRALTAAEVSQNFNALRGRFGI